jgi:integrase
LRARYRNGCLKKVMRNDGIERWVFRWRERTADGSLRQRKKIIGAVQEWPKNSKKLQDKLAGLRLMINTDGPTALTSITMAALVEHYKVHELSGNDGEGKAHSTRSRLKYYLNNWILPHWGRYDLIEIKTLAIEQWLKTLRTGESKEAKNLADGTKAKIRNILSALFNHAIRWEFSSRNPVTGPVRGSGVRQSAKRERIPDILEIEEMHRLIGSLQLRERVLVFLDMVTGLRRGELAGLKWQDVNFQLRQLNVVRSLVEQQVGKCKTEASQKPVPLDEYLIQDLLEWYEQTPFKEPNDWMFATDSNRAGEKRGKQPIWLSTVMRYHIQPIAKRLNIQKQLSWHTFRHTFSTVLKANGEDVKVVQELLRHASAKITLDTYSQALSPQKRAAQSKVVRMIRQQEKTECTFGVPRPNGEIVVTA